MASRAVDPTDAPLTIELADARSHPDLASIANDPEISPVLSRSNSVGPGTFPADDDSPATAGRKRKLNSTSSRGVAHLTPDQLAKKRANDRQAQRAIRERTKTHIDALEQQVRDLSSQKPFLDLQAAHRQNESMRSENRELRQGLRAAMDIIQPLLGKIEATGTLCVSLFRGPKLIIAARRTLFTSSAHVLPASIPYNPLPRSRQLHTEQPCPSTGRTVLS